MPADEATKVGHEDPAWTVPGRAVVVAVDGSRQNRAAIEWAADTAVGSDRPLTLLHVLDGSEIPLPFHRMEPDDTLGRRLLAAVAETVHSAHPEAHVLEELGIGRLEDTLVTRSAAQSAVVVGRRGHGTFLRLLIGSTSLKVCGRARVPVVVVPQDWDSRAHRREPVVVGVDHRDVQGEALLYAFLEAQRRGVTLIAAHGRELPARDWDQDPPPEFSAVEAAEQASPEALARVVAPFRDRFNDVHVELLHGHEHPLTVLLDRTGPAQLLVLGRHGSRDRRGSFPFGSVAQAALHYAEVPVAVVPPTARPVKETHGNLM
ncbi:universal stress protein [Nocardioides sp. Root151]|uniref:universal stress protein n=1 Tax=Nocardioides sp. Root151 TaxID=1736475 RepID=UPI00070335F0|nr:universal stress protein [Nocardioides sp. Root151]KQZ70353.1 hypothetical protein ASD66_12040 [Nocardioides sp. Root151]